MSTSTWKLTLGFAFMILMAHSEIADGASLVEPETHLTEPMTQDFGASVAVGDGILAVGDSESAQGRGSVYVYERDVDDTWQFAERLTDPGGEGSDLGASVAIARFDNGGDETWWIAAGDPSYEPTVTLQGAVVIFKREAGVWVFHQRLTGVDFGDQFGTAVAFDVAPCQDSGSNDPIFSLVVGAKGAGSCPACSGGRAYALSLRSGFFELDDTLSADPSQEFGAAVAISGDTIAIGAPRETGAFSSSGAVHIFKRINISCDWASIGSNPRLLASDAQAGDNLGSAVAMIGSLVVASSPQADPTGSESGKVYSFTGDLVNGGAIETPILPFAASRAENDHFGQALALSSEGVLAVSSTEVANTGAVYLYQSRGTNSTFSPLAKVLPTQQTTFDLFGSSVGLSRDTNSVEQLIVAIGARDEDFTSSSGGPGAAWVDVSFTEIFADGFETGDTSAWN